MVVTGYLFTRFRHCYFVVLQLNRHIQAGVLGPEVKLVPTRDEMLQIVQRALQEEGFEYMDLLDHPECSLLRRWSYGTGEARRLQSPANCLLVFQSRKAE